MIWKKRITLAISIILTLSMLSVFSLTTFGEESDIAGNNSQDTTSSTESIEEKIDTFTDLDQNEWYYNGVSYVVKKGIMNGTGETSFEPRGMTSRAMMVTMLWRMEGQPVADVAGFTDLEKDSWYESAVSWAAANQIVNGFDEKTFAPNVFITREQLASILYRYEQYKNRVNERFLDTNLLDFDDVDKVSDWATEALQWAVGAGIINGRTETTLVPDGNASRAEVATMLMRYDTQERTQDQDVYLTLVNKTHKLPDNWLDMIELVTAQNSMGREFQVERTALEQFEKLRDEMLSDGIDIELDSTYRSVQRQEELWAEFEEQYGLEYCQKYVAVPGFSEHHTGLAIDVCLIKDGEVIDDNDAMIAEKEIFAKVHEKLADYGFILRYLPEKEDVTGYSYEPWHFRYVGEKASKEIMEKGITLEEYLASEEDSSF